MGLEAMGLLHHPHHPPCPSSPLSAWPGCRGPCSDTEIQFQGEKFRVGGGEGKSEAGCSEDTFKIIHTVQKGNLREYVSHVVRLPSPPTAGLGWDLLLPPSAQGSSAGWGLKQPGCLQMGTRKKGKEGVVCRQFAGESLGGAL